MAFQILLSIPASIWIALLYYSSGDGVARLLRYKSNSVTEDILIKASLGFGIIGNLIMVLNFLNLSSRSGILLLLGLLTVVCIPRWFISLRQVDFRCIRTKPKIAMSIPFFVMAFLICLYTMRTFLPPTGFDALMYHLASAQLFLENSGFFDIFFNPQSDFPMLTEMNFMIGLALGNDLICRQIDLMLGVIACCTLLLNSKQCNLSKEEMLTGCIIFLTMTVVIASLSSCDVDLALAAWIALSVYMVRKAVKENSKNALLICAAFAAMAMETKIFGVFVLPVLFCAVLYLKEYRWKKMAILFIIPVMAAIPWYVKSYLNQGTISSINRTLIFDQGLGMPMGLEIQDPLLSAFVNSVVRVLASPWTFSIMPSQHQQDTLGPLFIVLLPFAIFVKLSCEAKYLLSMAGVYLVLVLVMEMFFIPGGSSIRYLLVVPLLLIPVCLHILKKIKEQHHGLYSLLMVLLVIQITCGAVLLIKRYHIDWSALILNKSRDKYYEAILPQYPAIKFINELQGKDTVMTIYNYDNYLIRKPYISALQKYCDNEQLINDIQKYSISYIFANDVFDTLSNSKIFPQLEHKQVIFVKNGFYVYEIQDRQTAK